jgi:Cu/Ag efflux pump CusA
MRWIVARSLRFRWLAVFGAAAVMLFGFIQAREAPLDVFPEFAPPIVEIQTIALGNTSTEVEELITIPIEDSLNGIEGLDKMRSYSVEQVSSIKLYFKRGPICTAPGNSCRNGSERSRRSCRRGRARPS